MTGDDIEKLWAELEGKARAELVARVLREVIANGVTFGELAALPIWEHVQRVPVAIVAAPTAEPAAPARKPRTRLLRRGDSGRMLEVIRSGDGADFAERSVGAVGGDLERAARALRSLRRQGKIERRNGVWVEVKA
jgi:hypothetical protein